METSKPRIRDRMQEVPDRYAPRFEVFLGKPQVTRDPLAFSIGAQAPVDPGTATREEKQRLDGSIFVSTGEAGAPPPKVGQLFPLAGPWGEKPGQHTDDVLSVEFTESIEKQQLATVKVEVLNVYDFKTGKYRYTDPLAEGDVPIIRYGDTLALRFGYGSDMNWVFEGIVTQLEASFPADGNSLVSVCAADKRERLRGQKKLDMKTAGKADEEKLIAQIVKQVGLRVAAPSGQSTPAEGTRRPADQDALQYISDRAGRIPLELRCFGDTLYVEKPGDKAAEALGYSYRAGLTSFKPVFDGVGKATEVHVRSRDPHTGKQVDVKVGTADLLAMGLAVASGGDTAVDTIAKQGQGGDRTEVVTNFLALDPEQAKRLALGILKKNVDAALTVSGEMIGDPQIRPRTTIHIGGVGRFSGYYYITSATHRLGPNGYQTSFNARRSSALD